MRTAMRLCLLLCVPVLAFSHPCIPAHYNTNASRYGHDLFACDDVGQSVKAQLRKAFSMLINLLRLLSGLERDITCFTHKSTCLEQDPVDHLATTCDLLPLS